MWIVTFGGQRGSEYASTDLADAEANARRLAGEGQAIVDANGNKYGETVRYQVRDEATRQIISTWPEWDAR